MGAQVTGDPHVPAQEVTLFTLDTSPIVGRYQGYEQDADGNALPDRPMGATFRPLPRAQACFKPGNQSALDFGRNFLRSLIA